MSNAYAIHALQSDYNTVPTTGWFGLEVDEDSFSSVVEPMQRTGLKRGTGAPLLANRRNTQKGATGALPLVAATNGIGKALSVAASSATSTLISGATTAHEQVFKWTSAGPPLNKILATEIYRDRYDGTYDAFTYLGGRCTQIEFGQELGTDGWLKMNMAMDYVRSILQGVNPNRTVTEINPDGLYNWEDPEITLWPKEGDEGSDGETECLSSLAATLPANLDTEKWCLKRGTGKHVPKRKGAPEPTGTLSWDYEHPRYFTAFKEATPFSLRATWTWPEAIETVSGDDIFPSFSIYLPSLVFTGSDPKSSPTENTTQDLPFAILDDTGHALDDSDPSVITITQVTSDSTL